MASSSKNVVKNVAMPKSDPLGPKPSGSAAACTSTSRKRPALDPADGVSPMNDHEIIDHDQETVHETENEHDAFSDSGSTESAYSNRNEHADFNMNDSEVQFDIDGTNDTQGCDEMLYSLIEDNYGTKKIDEHMAPRVSDLLAQTMTPGPYRSQTRLILSLPLSSVAFLSMSSL